MLIPFYSDFFQRNFRPWNRDSVGHNCNELNVTRNRRWIKGLRIIGIFAGFLYEKIRD